jgi:hypothetical protein
MKELFKYGDELVRAIDRYKNEIKRDKILELYILHGSTFFNSRYIDYLDKNYKENGGGVANGNEANTGELSETDKAIINQGIVRL